MAGIAWLGFQVHDGEVPRSWCFCQCLGGRAEQEIWPLAQSQQSDMDLFKSEIKMGFGDYMRFYMFFGDTLESWFTLGLCCSFLPLCILE